VADPFVPAGLTFPHGPVPPPRRPPRHRPGEKFLKGPIPWRWVEAAAVLPGKALAVGLAVWREAGCAKARTVTVTLARLSRPGWSADTTRRAVQALERAGLVAVERLPGHALRVTLTEPPTPAAGPATG
jgi:hypothetical protein